MALRAALKLASVSASLRESRAASELAFSNIASWACFSSSLICSR